MQIPNDVPAPDTFIEKSIAVGVVILIAFIINIIGRSLVKIPKISNIKRGKTYITFLRNCITLVILVISIHAILMILDINITPLLASAGVIGVIVGIGARSVFEDLIAGFFLTTQSSISVGDYINIGNNIEGSVTNIGLKNLTLKGGNGAYIIVPNGQIKNIVNLSSGNAVNVVSIPVKSTLPIDTLLKLFSDILSDLKKDKEFSIDPDSKVIGVTNIDGQNGITITTLLITPYTKRGQVDNEYRYQILKAFEKKKVSVFGPLQ